MTRSIPYAIDLHGHSDGARLKVNPEMICAYLPIQGGGTRLVGAGVCVDVRESIDEVAMKILETTDPVRLHEARELVARLVDALTQVHAHGYPKLMAEARAFLGESSP